MYSPFMKYDESPMCLNEDTDGASYAYSSSVTFPERFDRNHLQAYLCVVLSGVDLSSAHASHISMSG